MLDQQNELKAEITAKLARLAKLGPMLKGTISEVKLGPRKKGVGERVARLLTYKSKGNKTKAVYVAAARVPEVVEMIAKHREAVDSLEQVVELSVKLFKKKS